MKTVKLKKLAKKILTKYSDGHYTQFAGHENIIMAMKECAKEYHKQKIKEVMLNEGKLYNIICGRCFTHNKPDAKECEKCGNKFN